jgi:N-acylneuraminate cytidylyltransferase
LVDRAVRILLEHPEADSVRGVVPTGQNPYKMWRLDEKKRMQSLLSLDGIAEPYNSLRQSLPATYWQTGHIDAIRVETILQKNSMSGSVILPLMIDPRFSVDIDTMQDWQRAEWLISQGDLEIVTPSNTLPDSGND